MSTATQVLDLARSQLGTAESPTGSNRVKYTQWYGMVGAWCAMFQSWLAASTGNPTIHFAWCNSGRQAFQNGSYGTWIGAGNTPQPGDLCFWSDGSPNLAHVSIVESASSPTNFTTIDGNWGDAVRRLTRADHGNYQVAGFGRPRYAAGPAAPVGSKPAVPAGSPLLRWKPTMSTGVSVSQLQAALNYVAGVGLRVDGAYGEMTSGAVRSMQHLFKIGEDGIYGPDSSRVLNYAVAMK